ncbi:MAG TPA: cytochrome c-type biogenesis CcmF C-terminal domain-containing protein [Fimbriimonadaceae bacterium]|nr:cytochrome c-type biogenesis CcmF C-terminal domain-containing protein [Fimbriimonadaceae bacterium]
MDELPAPNFPAPPSWSITVGDLGKGLVYIAAFAFIVAVLCGIFGKGSDGSKRLARVGFIFGSLSLIAVFGFLASLFIANRFEYEYVWKHADSSNALGYRIAGIWSGQEGSFLLWGVCASLFGLLVLRGVGTFARWYVVVYSLFLGSIAGILAYESPFKLIELDGRTIVPFNGMGLAPTLQNYWVTIHPPTIFLGFGSLTALFALAAAAMLTKDRDGWIPIVRPWAIVATTLVGLGLCMGGFWAYETLGWGGFWMWDPVENVSFVPWCFAAAFLHGIIVQTTRGTWKTTNLLLGGLPFLAFLFGTFLTRSGFLADASVHSFAEMDRSALRLLVGLMGVSTLGFLGLWVFRLVQARGEARPEEPRGFNRESFYRFGVLLLMAMGVATLIGMSVPLIMALSGKKPAVVEERVYHMVLPWIFIPIMALMAIAPFVSWRGMPLRDLSKRVYSAFCVSIGLLGFVLLGFTLTPLGRIADLNAPMNFPGGIQIKGLGWVFFLAGLCLFAIVASVWRISEIAKASKLSWGPFVMHIGVAMTMAGLIISRGFERKAETRVIDGHPGQALGYMFRYAGQTAGRNDRENKIRIEVLRPGDAKNVVFEARPGLYYARSPMDESETPVAWPHIQHFVFHDLYLTLAPPQLQVSDEFTMNEGDTKTIGDLTITYKNLLRAGEPGQAGTRFGAGLSIKKREGEPQEVIPQMELGTDGPIQRPAVIDENLKVSLNGMDAGSRSVRLQLQREGMIFPLEVFHKPLSGLVWLGTAVMTLGGFMSALYRRRRPERPTTEFAPESVEDDRELLTRSPS